MTYVRGYIVSLMDLDNVRVEKIRIVRDRLPDILHIQVSEDSELDRYYIRDPNIVWEMREGVDAIYVRRQAYQILSDDMEKL